MMTLSLGQVQWSDLSEAIPAFLTVVGMPFTYSIANGIGFGLVSYVSIKLLGGRRQDLHPVTYILGALVLLRYVFLNE
jgi:AGZA family xanthine/uracil permease-like MFS transporter